MKAFLIGTVLLLAATLPAEAGITVQAWGGVGGKGVELFTLTIIDVSLRAGCESLSGLSGRIGAQD